jgi:hypothetical protein
MADIYISSDNLVTLTGLTDAETDAEVDDATVVMSLFSQTTKSPNAEAAVDKGGAPNEVGIPMDTGHGLVAGDYIRIEGSQNYNDEYEIQSVSANEIVIESAFTAETFLGTEVIYIGMKNGTNISMAAKGSGGIYTAIMPDTLQRMVEYSASQEYGGLTTTGLFYLFIEAVKASARMTKRLSLQAVYDS